MKLTAHKSVIDIDNFIGKSCILKYEINGRYEIEVTLPEFWDYNGLIEIIKESFKQITDNPTDIRSIHILSVKIDNSLLN